MGFSKSNRDKILGHPTIWVTQLAPGISYHTQFVETLTQFRSDLHESNVYLQSC